MIITKMMMMMMMMMMMIYQRNKDKFIAMKDKLEKVRVMNKRQSYVNDY